MGDESGWVGARRGRRRTVLAAATSEFGVHADGAARDYVARESDDALEAALGASPLVVVTGERLGGTSRSLHRAARRMLGDHRLLTVHDPHDADLPAVLARARRSVARSGPVVVLADDAPLGLLDQLATAAAALAADRPDVRLAVTVRRALLDAFLARPVRAAVGSALVTVAGAGSAPTAAVPVGRLRQALAPSRASVPVDLALRRAVVDWDRLGVPSPLTGRDLVALAACHLADLGADPVPARELRRAVREGMRPRADARVLRRTRRRSATHVVVDPALAHLADAEPAPVGWDVPTSLGRVLLERLGAGERGRVARVALARGDVAIALWVGVHLPPEEFSPAFALRMGEAVAEWSHRGGVAQGRYDHVAARWLAAAAAADVDDDDDAAARAGRAAEALHAAPARV